MSNFKELGIDNETGDKLISVLEEMESCVDKAISQLEHLEAHGELPMKELTDQQEWAKIEINSCYVPVVNSYFYDKELAVKIAEESMRVKQTIINGYIESTIG